MNADFADFTFKVSPELTLCYFTSNAFAGVSLKPPETTLIILQSPQMLHVYYLTLKGASWHNSWELDRIRTEYISDRA